MGSDKKILDDIARVAGGAVNILSGLQQQVKEEMRSRVDTLASRMELVPREDFEQARATIARLTRQIEKLEERLDTLEKKKSRTAEKTAAKTAKATKKKKSS